MECGEEEPDAATVEDARASWKRKAEAWLDNHAQADEGPEHREKFRKKSYEWLLGTEHQLQASMPGGWAHFAMSPARQASLSPFDWPHILVSPDQGSDGVCALGFLARVKDVNLSIAWDPSHGVWNDCRAALRWSDLHSFQLLMVVVYNMSYGPWSEAKWFHEVRQGLRTYMNLQRETAQECPLYNFYADAIAKDQQRLNNELMDAERKDLMEELGSAACFWQKGDKVSMCRFFGAHRAAKAFDKTWHSRLVGILFVGLSLGIFKKSALQSLMRGKLAAPAGNGEERTAMPRGNDEIRKLRAACANTLHLAALVLGDGHNQAIQRMVTSVCDPLERWHSAQNRGLRSASASKDWILAQVGGDFWKHLQSVLGQLSDLAVLEFVGLRLQDTGAPQRLTADHPVVAADDELASKMARFAFTLVGFRMQRHLEMLAGWPSRFALVYHQCEGVRDKILEQLRDDWRLFQFSESLRTNFWKKKRERSVFHTVSVLQLVKCSEREGWRSTEKLRQFAMQRETGLRASQVVEDGFQRERRMEARGSNDQVSEERVWSELLRKKVLETVHHYQPIDPCPSVPKAADLPRSLFVPQPRQASMQLSSIQGFNRTPQWCSPGAVSLPGLFADLELLRFADAHNAFDKAENCVLCVLCQPGLLLRHRQAGAWYFAVRPVCGILGVGWPAEVVPLQGYPKVQVFKPGACPDIFEFPWLHILDHKDWEAMEVEWLSPLGQRARWPKQNALGAINAQLLALSSSAPAPLLHVAARAAFWEFHLTHLRTIGRAIGKSIPSQATLFSALEFLIRAILGCGDGELAAILALRLKAKQSDLVDELVDCEEMADCMDRNDKEDFEKHKLERKMDASTKVGFTESLTKLRKKVADNTKAKAKAKASISSSRSGPRKHRHSSFPPGDDITESDANEQCPPGCQAFMDEYNGRWRLHLRGSPTISRSWGLHGFRQALVLCLQFVWKEYLTAHGQSIDEWPIPGIFDSSAPVVAGSGADSAQS